MAQTLRGVVVELASVYTFTYFKSNFWLSSPTKLLSQGTQLGFYSKEKCGRQLSHLFLSLNVPQPG